MEKEHWKDKVLRSLEGARRAEPDPQLYAKIQGKIGQTVQLQIVRPSYLALAAACLALLVMGNIWAVQQSHQQVSMPTAYQVDNSNFDLY